MIVKLLFGHICAGKTTFSKELVKKNNYIRLSMDDLKIMMFGRIPSDRQSEDIVSATIEHMINLIDGIDDYDRNIIIDGFPLNLNSIEYIKSLYNVEIVIFTVDLFKANLRNRKRAKEENIFIKPEDIKKYNEDFDILVKSEEFNKVVKGVNITHRYNYELQKNCLVM
jgi:adenylate kinase family enzyme